ncbi:MAG: hypothetical protein ABEJ65_11695 [bacterium]
MSEKTQEAINDSVDSRAPEAKLYSPKQIGVASFLGSFVAGSVLIALNEMSFSRDKKALAILGLSVPLFVLFAWGMYYIPGEAGTGVNAAVAVVMYQLANQLHGNEYEKHLRSGGSQQSHWKAGGIGCGTGVLLLVVMFLGFFGYEVFLGTSSTLTSNQVIQPESYKTFAHQKELYKVKHPESWDHHKGKAIQNMFMSPKQSPEDPYREMCMVLVERYNPESGGSVQSFSRSIKQKFLKQYPEVSFSVNETVTVGDKSVQKMVYQGPISKNKELKAMAHVYYKQPSGYVVNCYALPENFPTYKPVFEKMGRSLTILQN